MPKNNENLTPAMKQFHHFKDKYPDSVLFFRMGDFYETFYEDARICSKVLGLTLTSRSKGPEPIPLAGVPYHAVDNYLKKMLQAGYKVAVCEQIEDPKQAKGIVKRDVVRIVTPGTLTDDMLLDEKQENFLAAIAIGPENSALSWVDISTGHFYVQKITENEIIDEILRINPKEIIVPKNRADLFEKDMKKLIAQLKNLSNAVITERPSWYFDKHSARKNLTKHFKTQSLQGFGIDDDFIGTSAAGAIFEYLSETQKTSLKHISAIKKIDRSHFLRIDNNSLRSLEILYTIRTGSAKGSLIHSLDHTKTAMGARMLRNWICQPLCKLDSINYRQQGVAEINADSKLAEKLANILKNISDIERIVSRISTYRTTPKDLLHLAKTLKSMPELRLILEECKSDILKHLAKKCDSIDQLADLLSSAIVPQPPAHTRDGGVIKTGFNEELDQIRSISKDNRRFLANYQQKQIELTGLQNLKIGFNKVFGYYIEIPRSLAEKAPPNYHRKQTLKNAERYITEELKQYEEKVLTAQDRALELENTLFEQLREETTKYIERLQKLADTIATIDCILCLGFISADRSWTRPIISEKPKIKITDGKHPVLAEALGAEFVPNDTSLGEKDADIAVITGPNMSGKSTYIRQVALLTILAHTGSFIPAKNAEIGLTDRIFTRVGASDELLRNQSTFMVEMTETANIINNATEKSLVILDEVGRGTSTYDGLALAWAITEHIAQNIKARTLFATHYHELTALAELFGNIKNLNVAVREWMEQVVFLHKILPGKTDKSYGIHVAKLAGVPENVIKRSSQILQELEQNLNNETSHGPLTEKQTSNPDSLFVNQHKDVLEKLKNLDVNNLTPIEAINLLNQIKNQVNNADNKE